LIFAASWRGRGPRRSLVPDKAEQEAIREMVALRAQGKALRTIAAAAQAKGHQTFSYGADRLGAILRPQRI